MRPGQQRGLTLLEVLVALFVVSVALTAAMRALGVVTATSAAISPRLAAQWSAGNLMADYQLHHYWPEPGRVEVSCPQGQYDLVCVVEVSSTPNPSFRRMEVKVNQEGQSVVLSSLIGVLPKASDHVF
jgi:general secretion pathway protein I